MYHHLVFPSLTRIDEVSFKSWSESKGKTGVYKLNWDGFDKRILEKAVKAHYAVTVYDNDGNPMEREFEAPSQPLPKEWDEMLNKIEYAIPHHYLDEIRRMTHMGMLEWAQERHFNTSIREMCLEPAQTFIGCAFKLIADCCYDRNMNYFMRDDFKHFVAPLCIYRFWKHQTGDAHPIQHSGIDKLPERYVGYEETFGKVSVDMAVDIYDSIKAMEEKEDTMREPLMVDGDDLTHTPKSVMAPAVTKDGKKYFKKLTQETKDAYTGSKKKMVKFT